MDTKTNELKAIEASWKTLDDGSVIKDVLYKGKYISNAINFVKERREISLENAKKFFYDTCDDIIKVLVQNRQLHRSTHILNNAQLNEVHYFYNLFEESTSTNEKEFLLYHLTGYEERFDQSKLRPWWICFKLLRENIQKHAKYLESANRNHNTTAININTIHTSSFCQFMKQSIKWRNEIAVDVFFKSKKDLRSLELLPLLSKKLFFAYIIQNELSTLLRQWLNEQYCIMAGRTIQSTLSENPRNFDDALNYLFRRWTFEVEMMTQISRREKDVIKNEFAKLGLFEMRESRQICRKLNRFFTTHTFHENYSTLKSDDITKFVIENNLVDLLPRKFTDHEYVQLLLELNEKHLMYNELTLLESTTNLLSKETNLKDFIMIMNATTNFIQKYDKSFDSNSQELKFLNGVLDGDFNKLADINKFTKTLHTKLNSIDEKLPTIEQLLEIVNSININYIQDEFQDNSDDYIPNFDNSNISKYGENISLSYLDYVQRGQGVYATFAFIIEMMSNSMTLSRPTIMNGCEEVAKLAIQNFQNDKIVTHSTAFLETFSIDTRNLRCLLQLLKLKGNDEAKNFDVKIKISAANDDMKNTEALENYWKVKKTVNPKRLYLNDYIQNEDWLRLILFAQYFNYPLNEFITLCQSRIKNKTLCDNLIRAVSYSSDSISSELKRRQSFSKRRRSKVNELELKEMYANGKFLDSKHDLFAILLKCNDDISRIDLPFEAFKKFFKQQNDDALIDDLLFHAVKNDWPIICILAATTKLYRYKYCWLTWLILSSDYKLCGKFRTIEELAKNVFEHCLKNGFIKTLDDSAEIFYPDTALKTFTKFLRYTSNDNFKNDIESHLKQFIVQLNDVDYNMIIVKGKNILIPFIIRCLIIHLQSNIKFSVQQQLYLDSLHHSELGKYDSNIDFQLVQRFCKILDYTNVVINYEVFCDTEKNITKEIGIICNQLIDNNYFEAVIDIADLLNRPKTDFVFKWWLHMYKSENQKQTTFDINKYMRYVEIYELDMEVFIKFLKLIVDKMDQCIDKYNIMIFILRNTSNKSLEELDELEYEIHCLYLRLRVEKITNIEPLTSEYYENVIKHERNLIHLSLYEMKSVAMIDELTVSHRSINDDDADESSALDELIFRLLDLNDIIQVLRIQEMFGYLPENMKFLVYMLSVCEGITCVYDIRKEERQAVSSFGQLSNRFSRFTLRQVKTSSTNSMNSSVAASDLNETNEEPTVVIDNQTVFHMLQGILCRINHGASFGQRIFLIYRASQILNQNFNDLMKIKNSFELLELAATSNCEDNLLAMGDIIEAMNMSNDEVALFISKEITASIINTRFTQFSKDTDFGNVSTSSWSTTVQVDDSIWNVSFPKDFHKILALCKGKTTLLGNYLLKYYKILSQQFSENIPMHCHDCEELETLCVHLNRSLDQKSQVMSLKKRLMIKAEILIIAHDSFCYDCSTEGIGEILNLARVLIEELAERKNFHLIMKLLCGIGRYREMFYCFDILIKNDAFEVLLGQFSDKQKNGLKNALLAYLNEHHPNNLDFFKMAASHFSMHTEMAKLWRTSAFKKINKLLDESQVKILKTARINTNQIQQIEIPYLVCNKNVIPILNEVLTDMIHATEMVTIDNKIEMSLKYSHFCELIAMQIHLVKVGLNEKDDKQCPCVIHQETNAEKLQQISQYFANYSLSVPQMMILNKNVDIPIDYTKAIFCRSLIIGDETYLLELIGRITLTDAMIQNIVRLTQHENITNKQEKVLHDLVMMIRDVGLKFRLASLLGLKKLLQQLLNDEQSYHYLIDTKYGTQESL